MFNFIPNPELRKRKRKKVLLSKAEHVYSHKKLEFRHGLVNKLKFLHPSIELLINTQSPYFFGYKKDERIFITGRLDDSDLPDIFDLREQIELDDFEEHVREFIGKVHSYKMPRAYNRMVHTYMGEGSGYEIDLFPCEIRLSKNDKIIARSGLFSPKKKGYFDEILYENIVEDTAGSGVSSLSLAILVTNYGELNWDEVTYVYQDPPRKSVSQNIEHYIKICSLFTPFLNEIEIDITDPSERDMVYGPSDEDLDDTLLGLPANKRLEF